jgi:hypothetical protein
VHRIAEGEFKVIALVLLACSIVSPVGIVYGTYFGLRFHARFGYPTKGTIRNLEDYASWFLQNHVSRARLACKLRVYIRSTASYKTLLIILTVWGPYVALSALMVHDPLLNKARYFWVACQTCYLVALFVMLAGSRNSTSRARWSEIHIASMSSYSCCTTLNSMLLYDLSSRNNHYLVQGTSDFLLMGLILLRIGFAPMGLSFHEGLTPFLHDFIALLLEYDLRVWR